MISLLISFAVLILGYVVYSRVTERVFSPDDRQTPAYAMRDGVDFVPMKKWKSILIQLLNIAGTGPIFGALMGAVFGPKVFLWIILGTILGGGVHDYMTGMISSRHGGHSIAELSGTYVGKVFKYFMRIFSLVLLMLTGTVFVTSPAQLLADLTPQVLNHDFWVVVILLYFILATLLPIDKIIGRCYPVFGVILALMAVMLIGASYVAGKELPEWWSGVGRPDNLPTWPFMFVTVACGAVSGYHATQSPIIAKCIRSEKEGRPVFFGAMVIEAMIALVWAAVGVSFFGTTQILNEELTKLGQSGVVYEISKGLLGTFGGVLAIIGVVICPITSGDTSFRSARLILAEWTGLKQDKIKNRLILTIPLLVIGAVLTRIDYNIIWRYFSWANQTLAAISFIVFTFYLLKKGKHRFGSMITALPACFMTSISVTYLLVAPEGFNLPYTVGYPAGVVAAVLLFVFYLCQLYRFVLRPKGPVRTAGA